MIDIGINYIQECEECYKILKKYNFINTIKFPGRICDYTNLIDFINLAKYEELKIDLHGLPGMIPAINCMNNEFLENIDLEKLKKIFENNNNISRISTHIGLKHRDCFSNYSKGDVERKWKQNVNELKSNMKKILKQNIEIGLENIPGGFMFDKISLEPEYVSENWKKADFGVFDITHAKVASETLNITFDEYLERLTYIDKVKILHVSGNIDKTKKCETEPDKHVLIDEKEIETVIKIIKRFKNLDLIVSEYAFETQYSCKKELLIDAITLNKIVTTKDEEIAKSSLIFLKQNLKDDITNAIELLESQEWKNMK